MQECTFHPRTAASATPSVTLQARLKQLAKPHDFSQREKSKRELEDTNCTFQPNVSSQSRSLYSSKSCSRLSVQERLFREGQHRTRSREKQLRAALDRQRDSFAFQPSISASPRTSRVPLH